MTPIYITLFISDVTLESEELYVHTLKQRHNTMDQNKEVMSCCRIHWHNADKAG